MNIITSTQQSDSNNATIPIQSPGTTASLWPDIITTRMSGKYDNLEMALETAKKVLSKSVYMVLEEGNNRSTVAQFTMKVYKAFKNEPDLEAFGIICHPNQLRYMRHAIHLLIDADGNLTEDEVKNLEKGLHKEVAGKAFNEWLVPNYHKLRAVFITRLRAAKKNASVGGTNTAVVGPVSGKVTAARRKTPAPSGAVEKPKKPAPSSTCFVEAKVSTPLVANARLVAQVPRQGSEGESNLYAAGAISHPGDPRIVARRAVTVSVQDDVVKEDNIHEANTMDRVIEPRPRKRSGDFFLNKFVEERLGWVDEYPSIRRANRDKKCLMDGIKVHEANMATLKRRYEEEMAHLQAKRARIHEIEQVQVRLPDESRLADGALSIDEEIDNRKAAGKPTENLEKEKRLWKARYHESRA